MTAGREPKLGLRSVFYIGMQRSGILTYCSRKKKILSNQF